MKKVTLLAVLFSVGLLFISCGSKPEPEATTEPEAPVVTEEVVVEEKEPEVVDNESSIKKVDDARALAIEAGAENYAPELFAKLEELYQALKDNSEGKDLSAECSDLETRYSVLADYAKAKSVKEKIDAEELMTYAQSTYNEGVELLTSVEKAFEADQFDASVVETAHNAYVKFNKVYMIAYKLIAQKERDFALDAKKDADSVKASVSQKERYKVAADEFAAGDSAYSMQNPESAYNHYGVAKDEFEKLFVEVSEKRAEALRIMEEAKKRVEESKNFASDADVQAPISEPVEGIEEADAVLLEETKYEEVEVVEFEETLADEELEGYEVSEEITEENQEVVESESEVEPVEETEETESTEAPETESETPETEDSVESEEVSEESEPVTESEVVETESTENLEPIEDEIIEDELSEAE